MSSPSGITFLEEGGHTFLYVVVFPRSWRRHGWWTPNLARHHGLGYSFRADGHGVR